MATRSDTVTELGGCRLMVRPCHDGAVLIAAGGQLDLVNARDVGDILSDAARTSHLVVDLHNVEFIDSSGLRALLRTARIAKEAGWSLRLRQVPPRARKLIEISGVGDVLEVDASVDEVG